MDDKGNRSAVYEIWVQYEWHKQPALFLENRQNMRTTLMIDPPHSKFE